MCLFLYKFSDVKANIWPILLLLFYNNLYILTCDIWRIEKELQEMTLQNILFIIEGSNAIPTASNSTLDVLRAEVMAKLI